MHLNPTLIRIGLSLLLSVWPGLSADPAQQALDDLIRSEISSRHIPGLSVAVVREGTLVCAKGYGLANVELQSPATQQTVFELASVTKQFTATAIMMLIEEGKFSLEDRITAIIEGLPPSWNEITIRHLLNHTSGIKSYTSVPGFFDTAQLDLEPIEVVKPVADMPLEFPPGDRFAYSNTGYVLLGMVIETISGKPYGVFMSESIFVPLGMASTRMNDRKLIVPGRITQRYAGQSFAATCGRRIGNDRSGSSSMGQRASSAQVARRF